jgi:hypothetical protein
LDRRRKHGQKKGKTETYLIFGNSLVVINLMILWRSPNKDIYLSKGVSHVVFTLFVCLRIVMSNTYCVVFLLVLCRFSRLTICYCPFWWYWWNCLPLVFKCSFHKRANALIILRNLTCLLNLWNGLLSYLLQSAINEGKFQNWVTVHVALLVLRCAIMCLYVLSSAL